MALRAGVSVATVSRVFNLPTQVAPATRSVVEQAAAALGYRANASARTLRTQRSHTLGVVLPTLVNPVFAECFHGIAAAASAAGYSIVSMTTDYQLDREESAVSQLMAGNVDGLILVVSHPATSQALKKLKQAELPYVLVYNRHEDHACISVDGESAVAELVAWLVQMGHRQITMISGYVAASDRAYQRCRGYFLGMAQAGLQAQPVLQVSFVDGALQTVLELLRQPKRPTALVASNDLLAMRCLRAAYLANLSVPADLSVAGFDGIELGNDLTPQLSTVAQPNAAMGQHSAERLIQCLQGEQKLAPRDSLTLPHVLRAGESCAPPGTLRPERTC